MLSFCVSFLNLFVNKENHCEVEIYVMCFMNKTSAFFYDMLLKMYKLASNRLPKKNKR